MTCDCAKSCASAFIAVIWKSTSTRNRERLRPFRSIRNLRRLICAQRSRSCVERGRLEKWTWSPCCAFRVSSPESTAPSRRTRTPRKSWGRRSKLDEMRRAEGKHLVAELRDRLARIAGQVEQVSGLAASLRPAFARRLETRLKELLSGTTIDQARLAQEAALLAERSDISEELDRLRSHLQQFAKLLDGAGELGKKLDF